MAFLAVCTLTTGRAPFVPSASDTPGRTRQNAASPSGSNTRRRQLWRFPTTGMLLLACSERLVVSVQLQVVLRQVKPTRSKDIHRIFGAICILFASARLPTNQHCLIPGGLHFQSNKRGHIACKFSMRTVGEVDVLVSGNPLTFRRAAGGGCPGDYSGFCADKFMPAESSSYMTMAWQN